MMSVGNCLNVRCRLLILLLVLMQAQAFQRYSINKIGIFRPRTPLSLHTSLGSTVRLSENGKSNRVDVHFTTPFKPSPQLALLTHLSNHGWFKGIFNAMVLIPLLTSRFKRWVQQPIVFPNRPSASTNPQSTSSSPVTSIKDAHVKGYIKFLGRAKQRLHNYLTDYNSRMSPDQLQLPWNGKDPSQQGLLGLFLRTQMVRAGLKKKPNFRRRMLNAAVESLKL